VLRQAGAQVVDVNSVAAALKAFAEKVPDVLVSDIAMPDEDGYSLIKRIKEWEAANDRHIPSLALTAFAGETHRVRA